MSATVRTMTEIVPGLWMGGMPRAGEPLQRRMRDENIDLVVSTTTRHPHLPDGIEVIRVPFTDSLRMPRSERLAPAVEEISRGLLSGRKMLVHCAGGRNRSGLLVGMALHQVFGLPGPAIVDLLQGKREGALSNPIYRAYIAGLGSLET